LLAPFLKISRQQIPGKGEDPANRICCFSINVRVLLLRPSACETLMTASHSVSALLLGAMLCTIVGCGSSTSPTTSSGITDKAVVAIEGLTATVEAITNPGPGWLYRLTYHTHETAGRTGATLTATHVALSTGETADGDFKGPGVLTVPRVPAYGTITVVTNLTVLTTAATLPTAAGAASHVEFTISYTDDNGHTGSASAAADISPL
jgi:hypothetical protein